MKKNKKGFTLTELIVVIVIVAILAAVLIPTYAGIVKRARVSSDTQLVKSMNDALTLSQVENGSPDTFTEVLAVIRDEGYIVENLTPTTAGYDIVWNQTTGYFSLLDDKGSKVYSPDDDAKLANKWSLWKVAHTANDILLTTEAYSYYLTDSFSSTESNPLKVCAGVDVGNNTDVLGIEYKNETTTAKNVIVRSNGGKVTVNGPLDVVTHYGYADELIITAVAAASYHECGSIRAMTLSAGALHVVIEKEGYVGTFDNTDAPATGTIEVAGYVEEVTGGTAIPAASISGYIAVNKDQGEAGNKDNASFNITSLAELEDFRNRVNAGRTYEGITINLLTDIDLSGIYWVPIGIGTRKNGWITGATITGTHFKGIFDGHGHTITGLTNNGYEASMAYFSEKHYAETYVYGFFGVVADATIKNLTMTNVAIDAMKGTVTINNEQKTAKGDSIGAVVGFCAGSVTIDNCTVSGTIKGFDAVGGILGRAYNQDGDTEEETVKVTNCTNNAAITGGIKTAGIIGYASPTASSTQKCYLIVDSCKNTGAISATGLGFVSGIVCYGWDSTTDGISDDNTITNNINSGKLTQCEKYPAKGYCIAFIAMSCSGKYNAEQDAKKFENNSNNGGTAWFNNEELTEHIVKIQLLQMGYGSTDTGTSYEEADTTSGS